jgi:hypothetical protein
MPTGTPRRSRNIEMPWTPRPVLTATHPHVVAALRKRGRSPESWGKGNKAVIDQMNAEYTELRDKRPRMLMVLLKLALGTRTPVGTGGGFRAAPHSTRFSE